MEVTGKVIAISTSPKKGVVKTNVEKALLIQDWGIEGDAHAGKWHRQISLLALESIHKMKNAGLRDIKPGNFAENITTEFINLPGLKIGSSVRIGDNVMLEVTQIGKECHSRCAIYDAVGDCVMPREGIFAIVIHGGEISVNDVIEIID